jgi:hypothetical protein
MNAVHSARHRGDHRYYPENVPSLRISAKKFLSITGCLNLRGLSPLRHLQNAIPGAREKQFVFAHGFGRRKRPLPHLNLSLGLLLVHQREHELWSHTVSRQVRERNCTGDRNRNGLQRGGMKKWLDRSAGLEESVLAPGELF